MSERYCIKIRNRSKKRYFLGVLPRVLNYYKNHFICLIARSRGAKVGTDSYITFSLAKKANSNLTVGNNSIVETSKLDLRDKISIGDNVIINSGVQIIRASHNAHSADFETTSSELTISNYAWVTTNSLVLPSCSKIGMGAVIASGAVVVKDVGDLCIVAGNPAVFKKLRDKLPVNLITEALQGRDLKKYISARFESYYENR